MKKSVITIACIAALWGCSQTKTDKTMDKQELQLEQAWDKVFTQSDKVNHSKITFHNRYGITLAADLYVPKNANGKMAAIAVSGPFGAVKEQCSYLSNRQDVDAERIGIIGICGWGGMAVNAAAIDPRIKATVASTMYDMSKVNAEGYFESENTPEQRMEKRKAIAAQRTEDYRTGSYKRAGGVVDPLPDDAPWFVKDYYDYYKTPRGYHKRSGNSNDGWNVTGCQSFLNQPLLAWASEIETPVLLIHGEKAHSRYFSEYAFEKMTGKKCDGQSMTDGNKEILIIPGAVHTDLYDDKNGRIPYDKIEAFFKENLK